MSWRLAQKRNRTDPHRGEDGKGNLQEKSGNNVRKKELNVREKSYRRKNISER